MRAALLVMLALFAGAASAQEWVRVELLDQWRTDGRSSAAATLTGEDMDVVRMTGWQTATLLPWIAGWWSQMIETDCGDAGRLFSDGSVQSFSGAYEATGKITVDGGTLVVPDPSGVTDVEVETGGGLCVRPSTGCVTGTTYFCNCSVAPDLEYVYSCGNDPGSQTHLCVQCGDTDCTYLTENVTRTCSLTQSETAADGTWTPPAASEITWTVSGGLPGPILVDGELDLANSPALTVTGAPPAGALLLRASDGIAGTPGTLTAPAGLQIVVGANDIRLELAP